MAKQFFKVHNTQSNGTDLFRKMIYIDGMEVTFQITNTSLLQVYGHCNLEHRNLVTPPVTKPWNGAVMWAMRVGIRGPKPSPSWSAPSSLPPPTWITGAKMGANILNRAQHYATGEFQAAKVLTKAGYYRIELWGRSASTLSNLDGLIQVLRSKSPKDPANQMIVLVDDYP